MSDQPIPLTPEQAEQRQEMYERWAGWRDEMYQGWAERRQADAERQMEAGS